VTAPPVFDRRRSKDRERARARLGEREAKPLGRVRLRPNRGFPGCPAQRHDPPCIAPRIGLPENSHELVADDQRPTSSKSTIYFAGVTT
jgi:hypothetical protein